MKSENSRRWGWKWGWRSGKSRFKCSLQGFHFFLLPPLSLLVQELVVFSSVFHQSGASSGGAFDFHVHPLQLIRHHIEAGRRVNMTAKIRSLVRQVLERLTAV